MADYLFINGTDASIDNINAGGGDVAARSVLAATADDTELTTYLATATAIAVMKTDASAAEKKAVAFTLLKSAGVNLGDTLDTTAKLADPNQRDLFRRKQGVQEAVNLIEAIS